jgi:hypothetical protein
MRLDIMEDNSNDIVTPDRMLNSVLFIRQPGDNRAILFVEGDTDSRFYKILGCEEDFIVSGESILDNGKGNKEKVIEAIKLANQEGFKGVIGIVDADFDNLCDICTENNLYRTDTHDLESMLLKSENALKKILINYSEVDSSISVGEVSKTQNILLESAKYVGYALWCSTHNGWMVNFKNFPINACLDNNCHLDIQKMCKFMVSKSENDTLILEDIKIEICKKVSERWDLWQVCRGKEMVRVLSHYIKHNLKNGSVRSNMLIDNLLFAFEKNDFKNTFLYESIIKWQSQENYYIFNF